jgi:hypothetical protein
MSLVSNTSNVTASLTMTTTDLNTALQTFNHVEPPVNCKAAEVSIYSYLPLRAGATIGFSALSPILAWSTVFVRNIGGQGSGNVTVQLQPAGAGSATNAVNLDVGAMFLYISPALSGVLVSTITPGITSMFLVTDATTTTTVEVLLAG